MPTVDVISLENKVVGSLELAAEVFAADINEHLLYESVRHYMAGQRKGLASTKTRHEVAGSGKKLWKQKGTGRARMGSIRSPLWRHGGTTHGPQPRDYSYRLNKKMILGALRSALTAKLRDGELRVVDGFSLNADKTVLLVETAENRNLELGSRNIPGVKLVRSKDVTTYDILKYKHVLMSKSAAEKLSEALK